VLCRAAGAAPGEARFAGSSGDLGSSDRRSSLRRSNGHRDIADNLHVGSQLMWTTSNRGPDEWLATFADPVRAQAAIDRFTSNAYDLVIEGESYRKRLKPKSPAAKAGPTKKAGAGATTVLARSPFASSHSHCGHVAGLPSRARSLVPPTSSPPALDTAPITASSATLVSRRATSDPRASHAALHDPTRSARSGRSALTASARHGHRHSDDGRPQSAHRTCKSPEPAGAATQ
jgi:hypothetical protein